MATTKKSAPKKTAAKKTAAKKTAARTSSPVKKAAATSNTAASTVTDRPPDSPPVPMTSAPVDTPEAVAARETLHGRKKWGTGSDRDANLRKAGLDPVIVARERNRLRHEARNNQS